MSNHSEDSAGVSRRAVTTGAAWAVPTIMLAAAAPLASASPCVPPLTNWQFRQVSTNFNSGEFGVRTMANGSADSYYVRADQSPINANRNGYVHVFAPIDVVAGRTYSFDFTGLQNGGGGGRNLAARVDVFAGLRTTAQLDQQLTGTTAPTWLTNNSIWRASSYGNTGAGIPQVKLVNDGQIAPNSSTTSQPYSGTFTATTTESLFFAYTWLLTPTSGAANVNDDIALSLPTIACPA
ncbi:hypothetical protein HDC34_001886 [Pseudoclavibacter sp. JAI123]|uniref:hypothetical protein n=1 Tax=Pseudoclavibacter sp. JAI123 TaxID=2723065 RepID=UPI0015C9877B|nr:hypothetical protein [Pseudoclavibacter sp. JAI123]NYF13592.1 hypothetical protein [Pseudoclavibacter sp. JAI123]